ncbi:MAG: PDZ domain-containing protein [bacterium]|nr:PDZ domain-containing protein [bacterium]
MNIDTRHWGSELRRIVQNRSTSLLIVLSFVCLLASPLYASANTGLTENGQSPFRRVAEIVVPSVVSIEIIREMDSSLQDHPFFEQFRQFMPRQQDNQEPRMVPGSGSGFLVSDQGIIITNNHVIQDATTISVTLPGEKDSYTAEVLGTDPRTDLAVIGIIDGEDRRFPFIEYGDSDTARVGDWAIAIGNPLGELEGSLTVGVISAKGRSNLAIAGSAPTYQDFIQTDAAINFGNSGGPLVDIEGRVIGINTAINASGQGIGFAIPINLASKIIPQLIDHGRVIRAYLGVMPRELDSDYAEALGLEINRGILVEDVVSGTPADRAGLREGDVIVGLDEQAVDDVDRFRFMVAERNVGDMIVISVHRDGEVLEMSIELMEFPEDETSLAEMQATEETDWFGMEVEDVSSSSLVESLDLEADSGVVVTRIRIGSPAQLAELRVGDVIQKIKNVKIEDMDDFNDAARKFGKSDKRIGLLVQRRAYSTFLFITPEK